MLILSGVCVRQEPVLGAGWPGGAAEDQGERQHHDQDAGDQAQGPANKI